MKNPYKSISIILAVVCVGLISFIVGRASNASTVPPPDKFQIFDDAGRVRGEIGMDRGTPMFALYDEDGNNRIVGTQFFFRVRDPNAGSIEVEFMNGGQPSIMLNDELGNHAQRIIDLWKLADMVEASRDSSE
jgi:hypothetical protein